MFNGLRNTERRFSIADVEAIKIGTEDDTCIYFTVGGEELEVYVSRLKQCDLRDVVRVVLEKNKKEEVCDRRGWLEER